VGDPVDPGGLGQTLLVAVEAGVGNTELLAHGAAEGNSQGLRVLTAGGNRDEEDIAFATLADLMNPLLGHLDGLPEVHVRAVRAAVALEPARSEDRFVVYAAALGLILQRVEERPALIVV
jgi:hypothetical protein